MDGVRREVEFVSGLDILNLVSKEKKFNASGINSNNMDKNIVLSDEELELLITSLHCVDERNYNVYTTTYTPWSEAKELKENLRIKLKRVLLNV